MRIVRESLAVCLWGVVLFLHPLGVSGGPPTYDVVVYGGTSAGIAAAVQVVEMGKTVVVIEPTSHLGGLTTAGLGWTDAGDKRGIGGLARRFYREVKQHYDQPSSWMFEPSSAYARYQPEADAMWTFEPQVADRIFRRWIESAKVDVQLRERIVRTPTMLGVEKEGRRIVALRLESGRLIRGGMFIDATYEGDLMAAAGVRYTVGREANAVYNERLNGTQRTQNLHNHRFVVDVDPYRQPGQPSSGLLPGIEPTIAPEGTGDHRIQAYCFRMCLTNVTKNQTPFEKPSGYDEAWYELLFRTLRRGTIDFLSPTACSPTERPTRTIALLSPPILLE